jgi:hypothetical protein
MSKQTKIIADNELHLSELERLCRAVESQIGFDVLNSGDAVQSLPKESLTDLESFLKLEREKDDNNRIAQEIREWADQIRECSSELSLLRKALKEKHSIRNTSSESLGKALVQDYSDVYADFFGNTYADICALQNKIALYESEIAEVPVSPEKNRLVSSIKLSLDRSSKRTNTVFLRQKLARLFASGGTAAFQTASLKALYADKNLSSAIEYAYEVMLADEEEIAEFQDRVQELEDQIEEYTEFVKEAGLPGSRSSSAAAKIRELEKAINRNVIAEHIILTRVGKRFADSELEKRARAEKAQAAKKPPQKTPEDDEPEIISEETDSRDSIYTDTDVLIERLILLLKDIETCRQNIDKAHKAIEYEEISKTISALRAQISAADKKIDRLNAEKTKADDEIRLLAQKLELCKP